MNAIAEWVSRLSSIWKFWIVISPWDVGVRVRLGKWAVELAPGLHFRVPLIDEISLVNTRTRITTTPSVTLSAAGGKARVISASVAFRVREPLRAMLRYTNPSDAVVSNAQAEIVNLVPAASIEAAMRTHFAADGIEIEFVRYVEDVEVRTYRVINDTWKLMGDMHGSSTLGVPTNNRF